MIAVSSVRVLVRDGFPGELESTREQASSRQEPIMPIVTVQQGPRNIALKRELVRKITDAFVEAYQIPAETVQVWIHEVPTDSWGSAGKLVADK
jgi:4-oxalocrotonate tautomerase